MQENNASLHPKYKSCLSIYISRMLIRLQLKISPANYSREMRIGELSDNFLKLYAGEDIIYKRFNRSCSALLLEMPCWRLRSLFQHYIPIVRTILAISLISSFSNLFSLIIEKSVSKFLSLTLSFIIKTSLSETLM